MNNRTINTSLNSFSLNFFIIIFSLIWFIGLLSPLFFKTEQNDLYYFLKMFYSPVCHQNPEKSFVVNNKHFFVCSRCFGIYLGIIVASILMIFKDSIRIELKFLTFSFLSIIFDIIFYQLKIYSYNKIISLLTGIIFGTIFTLFIFRVIKESVIKVIK